jgi:hypothetical protein
MVEVACITVEWNCQILFKKASMSVCTSTIVISPDLLSPPPSTSSAMNTPESREEDSDDPELADEGDIQVENSLD